MFKEKIRVLLLGGSLTDHGSYADGNYQGYPVVITTESTIYHVRINAVSTQDPDNAQLAQYLEYQKQNVKHLADYSCTSTSALLTIKMPAVNGNKVPDMINSVVDPLIQYLHGGNYQPCCESCGNTQEYLSNYEVNGSYHYLCTSCAQQIEQNLQQNQQTTRAKKSNLVAGLVGAFVGSLIGCVLWVLIYRLGYIAGIAGARFYTDEDLARLQQILLLKFLGFSLDDIRDMTINDTDYHFMRDSLDVQLKLVRDRIEQLQLVEKAIQDTSDAIQTQHTIDWNQMLDLIHLTGMEKSMKNQYQNATNIAARIKLHSLYSINKEGWFPWIYSQCHLQSGMNVLELGCGDGALWKQNISLLPQNIHLTLSDISDGMLRDARRALGARDSRFSFAAFDCEKIPAASESYDLSANKLYEKFGRENGAQVLEPWFSRVEWISYEDGLLVSDPEPLISYILSCHGNQNQYLLDHYKEFRSFVKKKTEKGLHITKDAGIFICNY